MRCTKISPEFKCQGERSRSSMTTKKCVILFGSRPRGSCLVRQFYGGGKVSACCLVVIYVQLANTCCQQFRKVFSDWDICVITADPQ